MAACNWNRAATCVRAYVRALVNRVCAFGGPSWYSSCFACGLFPGQHAACVLMQLMSWGIPTSTKCLDSTDLAPFALCTQDRGPDGLRRHVASPPRLQGSPHPPSLQAAQAIGCSGCGSSRWAALRSRCACIDVGHAYRRRQHTETDTVQLHIKYGGRELVYDIVRGWRADDAPSLKT